MTTPPNVLLEVALRALEREAETSRDAARLYAELDDSLRYSTWVALETVLHFNCGGRIMARPGLLAVLLHDLAAAYPVPAWLMQ